MDPVSLTLAIGPVLLKAAHLAKLTHDVTSKLKSTPETLASIITECNGVNHILLEVQHLGYEDLSCLQPERRIRFQDEIASLIIACTQALSAIQKQIESSETQDGVLIGPMRRLRLKDKLKVFWNEEEIKSNLTKLQRLQGTIATNLTLIHISLDSNTNRMVTNTNELVVNQGTALTAFFERSRARKKRNTSNDDQSSRFSIASTSNSSVSDTAFDFDNEAMKTKIYQDALRGQISGPSLQRHLDANASLRAVFSVRQSQLYDEPQVDFSVLDFPLDLALSTDSQSSDNAPITETQSMTEPLIPNDGFATESTDLLSSVVEVAGPSTDSEAIPESMPTEQASPVVTDLVTTTNSSKEKIIKMVVVGDEAKLKTNLIISYTTKNYPAEYVPTVFDNYKVDILIGDEPYTLGLFDTHGQEDYDRLRPLSYPQTDVFILCANIDSKIQFESARNKWAPELKHHAPGVPIILVGVKDAGLDEERRGTAKLGDLKAYGKELARTIGAVAYLECDSVTQEGLKEVFDEAIIAVLSRVPPKKKKKEKKDSRWRRNASKVMAPVIEEEVSPAIRGQVVHDFDVQPAPRAPSPPKGLNLWM